MQKLLCLTVGVIFGLGLASGKAALVLTGKSGLNTTDVDTAVVGSGDLFNSAPTAALPSSPTVTGNLANLVDSSLSGSSSQYRVDVLAAGTAYTLTWALDLGASSNGYDLNELRVFTSQSNALIFQGYDLEVKYVGAGSFIKLNSSEIVYPGSVRGTTHEDDFFNSPGYTDVTVTEYVETIVKDDTSSAFASGVAEVRLTLYPVAQGFGASNALFATMGNSFKGMQLVNIDMLGTASAVPEPSTFALLGLGSGLMALLRRLSGSRRRKSD